MTLSTSTFYLAQCGATAGSSVICFILLNIHTVLQLVRQQETRLQNLRVALGVSHRYFLSRSSCINMYILLSFAVFAALT